MGKLINPSLPVLALAFAPFILSVKRGRRGFSRTHFPHPWRCWTLLLVEEGVLTLRAGGWSAEAAPGRVVLIPPRFKVDLKRTRGCWIRAIECDVLHREREFREGHGWRPLEPGRYQASPNELWCRPAKGVLSEEQSKVLAPEIRAITNAWWKSETDQFLCNVRLTNLMATLFQHLLAKGGGAGPFSALEKAEAYARDGFSHGCTVDDMAAAAGMSRGSFSRAYTGWREQTPGAFLRGLRYKRAHELLRGTALPMEKVVRGAGFRSLHTFCASFKKREGLSPYEWRKRHAASRLPS